MRPIVSEKGETLISKTNTYAFVVDNKTNKLEIKKAIEKMFTVNVVNVNTIVMPAKQKVRNTKSGIVRGRISPYKKAYVTLAEGEELELFNNEGE